MDLAANLGIENEDDFRKLYDCLCSLGLRCGLRAMSLNTEQIAVDREDFEKAQFLATGIVVRKRLTVRLYESGELRKARSQPLLEVWEKGQKVRVEQFKLY